MRSIVMAGALHQSSAMNDDNFQDVDQYARRPTWKAVSRD